jgi:predicted amidohydrolase
VRVVLAAAQCAKGDIEANVAMHAAVLADAHAHDADLVVFPEMSLTGSVDPCRHPERLVTIRGPEVDAMLAATCDRRAAVVFGIAERDGDDAYITQCVARDGALVTSARKRHLGEDEDGFRVGSERTVFEHAGTTIGLMICAESTVEYVFDDAVDAGARLVCFCAAPGLYGRRTTDADRAAGLAWWESAGLADACRHARRRRVWVALATQAGATVDEDFPGLAALVDPNGEVVARTPDWHPATLVADLDPFLSAI